MIITALLDDSDPYRKARYALLNPQTKLLGLACVEHFQYDSVIAILLADTLL
jgi:hypothetical protein